MSRTLLDILMASQSAMSKGEFGRVMHDPESTEEEKAEALEKLAEAGGYENLPDLD